MASFLEYILDSIYVFKVVDFIFFFFFWSKGSNTNLLVIIEFHTLICLLEWLYN